MRKILFVGAALLCAVTVFARPRAFNPVAEAVAALAEDRGGSELGAMTVADIEKAVARLSVAMKQEAWIRGSGMASLALPGLGQYLNHDPLAGSLYLAGSLAVGASWFVLKDYQKDRIRTFLDPDLAARGAGYQVRQARIAIGSGGIVGKGWKEGTQSRLGFLPVRHSDFIFAALAEERGFAGVATVVGLYGLFLARGFAIARDARDRGGSMLVLLVILNVVAQAAANIAMNVGLLPTTGITLPFVSYGGSSIIATWAMTGLVLSVAQRRFVNV